MSDQEKVYLNESLKAKPKGKDLSEYSQWFPKNSSATSEGVGGKVAYTGYYINGKWKAVPRALWLDEKFYPFSLNYSFTQESSNPELSLTDRQMRLTQHRGRNTFRRDK